MALTALFTGAQGLQANSTALDVVGNNLANSNTTAFKSQRVLFKDFVYQTLSAGSAPSGQSGGVNPTQLGFGGGVGAIDTSLQQGTLNPTGRNLDVGIQGAGYFQVSNGNQTLFTRSGAFDVDADGFLIDLNTGFRVQRFGTTGESTATVPGFQVAGDNSIRIPFGAGVQGVQTTSVNYQGNLSATVAIGQSVSTAIQIFDGQSNPRTLTVQFTKVAANSFSINPTVTGGTVAPIATTLDFDGNGLITNPNPANVNITINGLPTPQTITLNLGTVGQATGLTQFGGVSTAAAITQDGRGAGSLVNVSVDNSGVIQGVFSNGLTQPLAQLAIASFNNPGGLTRVGNNQFSVSPASGEALIGVAGTGGRGSTQGGTLEGANVDVAIEFSRLVIAQRGFQFNSRTITAANELLQELANIIR